MAALLGRIAPYSQLCSSWQLLIIIIIIFELFWKGADPNGEPDYRSSLVSPPR